MSKMALDEFEVEICRTSYQFATIRVKAANELEAEMKAQRIEGDQLYNEKTAEYSTVGVRKVEK